MEGIRPIHPGEYVREDCLEPLGLSITAAAKALGVTRLTLSNLVSGKNGVSPEMAVRLAKAFGSTPEQWLRLQMQWDLAQVPATRIVVTRVKPVAEKGKNKSLAAKKKLNKIKKRKALERSEESRDRKRG